MWFTRMSLEDWFDTYQYEVQYDIGESAVKYLTFDQLGVDLGKLPIRYGYHWGRPDLRELIANNHPGLDAGPMPAGCSRRRRSVVMSVKS